MAAEHHFKLIGPAVVKTGSPDAYDDAEDYDGA